MFSEKVISSDSRKNRRKSLVFTVSEKEQFLHEHGFHLKTNQDTCKRSTNSIVFCTFPMPICAIIYQVLKPHKTLITHEGSVLSDGRARKILVSKSTQCIYFCHAHFMLVRTRCPDQISSAFNLCS